MEIQQLRHFVAAAEERHFTRAARREHIVQSGLSASIKALEDELGAALFIRSTRRVELTESGSAFLVEARHVLSAAQTAADAVKAVEGLLRGNLSIGIMQRFASYVDLPAVLGGFHADHPGVQIKLHQAGAAVLMESLRQNRIDIAILALVEKAPEMITAILLERDTPVLVVPPNHPLSRKKQVSLSTLSGETFVEFQPDWAARELANRAFAAARVQRKISCEVNDIPTLLDLVANGLGIALIPRAFSQYRANIRLVNPRPPQPTWEVVVAHMGVQPANAAARAFLNALRKAREAGAAQGVKRER